jgi:hypothetical protein
MPGNLADPIAARQEVGRHEGVPETEALRRRHRRAAADELLRREVRRHLPPQLAGVPDRAAALQVRGDLLLRVASSIPPISGPSCPSTRPSTSSSPSFVGSTSKPRPAGPDLAEPGAEDVVDVALPPLAGVEEGLLG